MGLSKETKDRVLAKVLSLMSFETIDEFVGGLHAFDSFRVLGIHPHPEHAAFFAVLDVLDDPNGQGLRISFERQNDKWVAVEAERVNIVDRDDLAEAIAEAIAD